MNNNSLGQLCFFLQPSALEITRGHGFPCESESPCTSYAFDLQRFGLLCCRVFKSWFV